MAITSGIYRIKNLKSGTYLDGGRPLHLVGHHLHKDKDDAPHQQWEVIQLPNNIGYQLKNVASGGFVHANAPTNQTAVQTDPYQPTTWEFRAEKDDNYVILYKGTKGAIDLDQGQGTNMTQANIWADSGVPQQKWKFERVITGPVDSKGDAIKAGTPYTIKSAATGTALDLSHGYSYPGTPVFGHKANGGKNQQWILEATTGGNYNLKNVQAGTYLSFYDTTPAAQGVYLLGSDIKAEWKLVAKDKGNQFVLTTTPLALDLAGSSSADGTRVLLWGPSEGDNQKWVFEP